MEMLIRLGETTDILGIIKLQKANLYANLSDLERKRGFVTIPFSETQLMELLEQRGVFVAQERDEIVGYILAGSWDFFDKWPIFPYMVSRLKSLVFLDQPISQGQSFEYGPICIADSYRGTGLFQKLFEEMRIEFSSRYPVGVTFINRINELSFKAHTHKLGLKIIDEFVFDGKNFYGLAFDTSKSVIN
ncbi:MAG: GNAT family acetyltransferase [Nitrospirae bacterium]|nr:GNAT family acetyltransferase [Nitrospirota bacterium]